MVKIALLICGTLTGKAHVKNGDYYDVYLRYMRDSLPQQADFIFDPYDVRVKMEYPVHEDDYNCMVLTGSRECSTFFVNNLADMTTSCFCI